MHEENVLTRFIGEKLKILMLFDILTRK